MSEWLSRRGNGEVEGASAFPFSPETVPPLFVSVHTHDNVVLGRPATGTVRFKKGLFEEEKDIYTFIAFLREPEAEVLEISFRSGPLVRFVKKSRLESRRPFVIKGGSRVAFLNSRVATQQPGLSYLQTPRVELRVRRDWDQIQSPGPKVIPPERANEPMPLVRPSLKNSDPATIPFPVTAAKRPVPPVTV